MPNLSARILSQAGGARGRRISRQFRGASRGLVSGRGGGSSSRQSFRDFQDEQRAIERQEAQQAQQVQVSTLEPEVTNTRLEQARTEELSLSQSQTDSFTGLTRRPGESDAAFNARNNRVIRSVEVSTGQEITRPSISNGGSLGSQGSLSASILGTSAVSPSITTGLTAPITRRNELLGGFTQGEIRRFGTSSAPNFLANVALDRDVSFRRGLQIRGAVQESEARGITNFGLASIEGGANVLTSVGSRTFSDRAGLVSGGNSISLPRVSPGPVPLASFRRQASLTAGAIGGGVIGGVTAFSQGRQATGSISGGLANVGRSTNPFAQPRPGTFVSPVREQDIGARTSSLQFIDDTTFRADAIGIGREGTGITAQASTRGRVGIDGRGSDIGSVRTRSPALEIDVFGRPTRGTATIQAPVIRNFQTLSSDDTTLTFSQNIVGGRRRPSVSFGQEAVRTGDTSIGRSITFDERGDFGLGFDVVSRPPSASGSSAGTTLVRRTGGRSTPLSDTFTRPAVSVTQDPVGITGFSTGSLRSAQTPRTGTRTTVNNNQAGFSLERPRVAQQTLDLQPRSPTRSASTNTFQNLGLSTSTRSTTSGRTTPLINLGFGTSQRPVTTSITTQPPIQLPKTTTRPTPTIFGFANPITRQTSPPPLTPFGRVRNDFNFRGSIPSFSPGLGLSRPRRTRRRVRRTFRRRPSLGAVILDIRAPRRARGEETGLVLRPILN